jgi:MATE family multidrug resistance protein
MPMAPLWDECRPDRGTARQLLRVAWPLVLSNSFWMLQISLDRIFLSRHGSSDVGAAMASVMLLWVPLGLLQYTAGYATTFVAQYTGAGRPYRVGAAVWQALYFSLLAGLAFLLLVPVADDLVALGGHEPAVRQREAAYFRTLCFSALPILVSAAATSFFTGRGQSTTVLAINAAGLAVNAVLAYCWIFGAAGFPEWGIVGAGWATVAGSSTSALLALALLWQPAYRKEFATASAWPFDAELFRRLLRFGVPNGVAASLEALAFTLVIWLIGRIGSTELAATSIAFTLNLIVYFPAMGLAQAVSVLVGQRLGEDRPDRAARATWTGLWLALGFTLAVGGVYLVAPDTLAGLFRSQEAGEWARIGVLVPVLLRFVVVYCLFDAMNLVFSFALRGAGDTWYVTAVALELSWQVLVLPAWAAWYFGWGLYAAWCFVSLYTMTLALAFLLRFRQGRWRTMRVIESQPVDLAGVGGEKG